MENIWFQSALWMALALVAAMASLLITISAALFEIIVGAIAGNTVGLPLTPWINYIASFQVEVLSLHLYHQIRQDLIREGHRRGLLAEFPQWPYQGLIPFTYINAEACARELRVHAFHGFPEELALVKTQSIFEVK